MLKRIIAALALVLMASTAMAESYEGGYAAFERGDYTEAVGHWQVCAHDQGDMYCQSLLGTMYNEGKGVPQDYVEAVRFYRYAADQGETTAQYALGTMYRLGKGVAQDYAEAARWFRLSADQGYAPAQNNLGVRYSDGKGVAQDYVLAHMWYNLAAAQGHEDAAGNRDRVSKRMTSAQIAEAQALAREWRPKQ